MSVSILPDYALRVVFLDGTSGTVELRDLIQSPNAGVFGRLKEPGAFVKAYVDQGAVAWPGNLDLAPDAMYDDIVAMGYSRPLG